MAQILLVDDVRLVRATLAKFLASVGHEVAQTDSVAAALNHVESHPVHLVITDLWMPEADGRTLIRTLAQRRPRLPVIAITGGSPGITETDSLEVALAAGAVSVLMKPVTRQDLLGAVDQALCSVRESAAR
ncbi:response regulator [Pararhodospirillum photometricum]|nr:response regulator [Pararhodospirillum photometricum]